MMILLYFYYIFLNIVKHDIILQTLIKIYRIVEKNLEKFKRFYILTKKKSKNRILFIVSQ